MIDTHVLGSGRVPVRSPLDQPPVGRAPGIGGSGSPPIAEASPPPRPLHLPAAPPDADDEPDAPGPRSVAKPARLGDDRSVKLITSSATGGARMWVGQVFAPFADAQVAAINAYQAAGANRFTCGEYRCQRGLVAAADGLHCPGCGYRFSWVWAWVGSRTADAVGSRPRRCGRAPRG
jgi:hypothetical protein